MWNNVDFGVLVGKTLSGVTRQGESIRFVVDEHESYIMHHDQDCCESVVIDDICGYLGDLIGSPILQAEESSNRDHPKSEFGYPDESCTWTFYRIATIKGQVVIRWYGASNGYYSEGVDFEKEAPHE